MKGRTEAVKLALEILTPVHVGSGQELHLNLDYVAQGDQPFVVDQNRTFEAVASGNAALDSLLQGTPELGDLVRLANAYYGYGLPPLHGRLARMPQLIREHLKDARFRPYVPGSSLKGAIRTVLMAEWLRRQPEATWQVSMPVWDDRKKKPSAPAKFAAKRLTEKLFGTNPNRDLLRALHVGDANYHTGQLRVADIRWMNIIKQAGREQARWRDMGSRQSVPDWQQASGLHAEVLMPGSVAPVTLQWDGFLLSDVKRWNTPEHADDLLPKDFPALAGVLKRHALFVLEREQAFFTQYGRQAVARQCAQLCQQIQQDGEGAYLRLAWGSGWRGMTGDWQDDDTVRTMRKLYFLGRKEAEQFPKTRRLAVQGEPCLPLGWIRLGPWRDDHAQEFVSVTAVQQIDRHPWVEEQLSLIQKQNRCQPGEVLRGQQLAKAWEMIEDAEVKKQALADIRRRWDEQGWWENPPGKAAKKALAIYQSE